MWSYVGSKANKQWIWLAIDCTLREIVGVYIGVSEAPLKEARSSQSAKQLWRKRSSSLWEARFHQSTGACAVCYTDFWEAYEQVLPSKRHHAVGKDSGQTSYIERFNNTLRQRVARLVRKTLSFSKSLDNHIEAVWYFVHHYNACLRQ